MYAAVMPRTPYTYEQVVAAFHAKHEPGPGGCWLWTGANSGRSAPYPILRVEGRNVGAHRWSLENLGGKAPAPGDECEHTCNVSMCVNPAHLEWVTHLENERRKTARGRRPTGPGIYAQPCSTHGPKTGRGRRGDGREWAYCVPCRTEYDAAYHQRRKAARAAVRA